MARHRRSPSPFSLLLILFLALAPLALAADPTPATGTVTGRVFARSSERPLTGAEVRLAGSGFSTVSDASGSFRLVRVPVGRYTLETTYLGYTRSAIEVEVVAGTESAQEVVLQPAHHVEEAVKVVAEPILQGQANALNQQKTAPNIKNVVSSDLMGSFPDANSAEATQRVPGVTLQRDQGEGRYVFVRGAEPRFTSTAVNGQALPSPDGAIRYVALDVVPADLLESIEVTKAITPDMDGDTIGGAVNLVTKQAAGGDLLAWRVGLGRNDSSGNGMGTVNVSFARRFLDQRLGFAVSGSYLDTDRGSETFEAEYDDGDLDQFETRHYTINRKRKGAMVDLSYLASRRSSLFVRGMYSEFEDLEYRRRLRNRVDKDRIEREMKDRYEVQQILSVAAGGRFIGSRLNLDYEVSFSRAGEDEPDRLDTTFWQKDILFDPNVSPGSIDPDNIQPNPQNENPDAYLLKDVDWENNTTDDRETSALVNLGQSFVMGGARSGSWKVGIKARFREKEQDRNKIDYEPLTDVSMNEFIDASFNPGAILSGRYSMGSFPESGTGVWLMDNLTLAGERDLEEDLGDYEATEDTMAGYGQVDIPLGARLNLLTGLRYEHVDVEYTGREIVFDDGGDLAGIAPLAGSNVYSQVLPMAHLTYRVAPNTNLRAAVTRTYARPDFFDLVPYQMIAEEDLEIRRGNPELKPTRSWNADLMAEHYFESVGVISGGLFYKRLTDNIYRAHFSEVRGSEVYEVTAPANLGESRLFGVEATYQDRFRSLPSPLDGFGLYANWTYTDSSAEVPGRDGGPMQIPGQARNVGNLALIYEKYGFSGRLAVNYHDSYLWSVGETPANDIFVDKHVQVDFSASQRIYGPLSLFAEVVNLTDEPKRRYEGTPDRPILEEYYSWWGMFGVKWAK